MSVGFRFYQAGFTHIGVWARAVLSTNIFYRGSRFGLPDLNSVMSLAPGSEVYSGIEITVQAMPAPTGVHPVRQCQFLVDIPAGRTPPTGGEPPISSRDLTATPLLLVGDLASELAPSGVADRTGEVVVARHSRNVQVLEDEPVVGIDQCVRDLVQKMGADIADTMMMSRQPCNGSCTPS
uniref:hypothetical protein n=1 Tax=Nocardia sp. XZ_19_385 TaxID=2769488 RepID=UPI001E4F1F4B|nr:hypothetical protein [Nocardia sp. XZ_19_385]